MRPEVRVILDRPVRVWRGGAGEPVLLLQGGMADAALHWSPVWDALCERFEVIAPDWPGFGGSQALASSTYPAMLDWMAAFQAEAVGAPAHLIGNSFGGTMAVLYAARRPQDVRRLAVLNGGGLPSQAMAQAILAAPEGGDLLAEVGAAAFSREALARMVADEAILTDAFVAACQGNPVILRILREALAGGLPHVRTPTASTLVLWGEADRHTPPEMGRAVAAAMPGADFRLIPGAGHLPQVEQPAATADAIIAFLADERRP